MPKREISSNIPEPDRARDSVIMRCRVEVEPKIKAAIRRFLIPLARCYLGVEELGEGFHWGSNIRIGKGSRIGRYAYLGEGFEAYGPVVVGDLCMIAAGCKIVGADHVYNLFGTPTRLAFPHEERHITTFGVDVWVGQRVTIIEGLTIGSGAVIGSGAIVTKDVLPYAVMAGVPAKFIKWRMPEDQIAAHHATVAEGGAGTNIERSL